MAGRLSLAAIVVSYHLPLGMLVRRAARAIPWRLLFRMSGSPLERLAGEGDSGMDWDLFAPLCRRLASWLTARRDWLLSRFALSTGRAPSGAANGILYVGLALQ